MTIIVKTPDELLSALNRLATERIEHAVTTAQRELAVFAFDQWTSSKFTWSPRQPNDVWSGQSRESINVSVGSPDPTYARDNPGPWPNHTSPYAPRDPFEARFKLERIPAWDTVYVSSNAPHAVKVEARTQGMHGAAEFTRSHFRGFQWSSVLNQYSSVPF